MQMCKMRVRQTLLWNMCQRLNPPMGVAYLKDYFIVHCDLFLVSAFTIMAFNNDVGVSEVFAKFYMQVMGKESSGFTELEVFYSIGIAFGILVFFNHVGRKRSHRTRLRCRWKCVSMKMI